MLKKKASWKLVSGCLAAVITLASAIVFTADAKDISSSKAQEQTVASQTSAADETIAGTMANYEASQTQKISFAQKKTDNVAMAMYDTKDAPVATTADTQDSEPTTTTSVVMPYIYDGYVPSSYTTSVTNTAQPQIVKTTTTTYKAAATTTTTKAAATTTTKSVVTLGQPGELAKPVILPEKTYDTDYTHPYNKQTSQIKLHWNAVSGASKYLVYVKNGQYANWTNVVSTALTECTVTGLNRDTLYAFAVKAVDAGGNTSELSAEVNIKTARMDYSAAGWQAMCRIVYHEVGGAAGSVWDKPIVYVADCVTNQYVSAKYTKQGSWPKYYSKYPSIESVIYTSGGFMSDAGLTARGATYAKVTERVKKAVWGAVYGITYYNNIANDYNVFYWCNSATAKTDSRIAYGFKIPWGGYMYIWRQYWG